MKKRRQVTQREWLVRRAAMWDEATLLVEFSEIIQNLLTPRQIQVLYRNTRRWVKS